MPEQHPDNLPNTYIELEFDLGDQQEIIPAEPMVIGDMVDIAHQIERLAPAPDLIYNLGDKNRAKSIRILNRNLVNANLHFEHLLELEEDIYLVRQVVADSHNLGYLHAQTLSFKSFGEPKPKAARNKNFVFHCARIDTDTINNTGIMRRNEAFERLSIQEFTVLYTDIVELRNRLTTRQQK